MHFADHTIPELTVSQVCTLMEQTSDLLVGHVKDGSSSNNVSTTHGYHIQIICFSD